MSEVTELKFTSDPPSVESVEHGELVVKQDKAVFNLVLKLSNGKFNQLRIETTPDKYTFLRELDAVDQSLLTLQ